MTDYAMLIARLEQGSGVTLAINTVEPDKTSSHLMPRGPDSAGVADPRSGFSRCAEPARALCAATLKVLEAQETRYGQ